MNITLLSIPQTAERLNLPVSKIYVLVRSKDFPAIKLGKSWRILSDKLDEWVVDQLKAKPNVY